MLNAGGFLSNMMTQPDAKLRALSDEDYAALGRRYFNNIEWLKGCVRFWLQRSGL